MADPSCSGHDGQCASTPVVGCRWFTTRIHRLLLARTSPAPTLLFLGADSSIRLLHNAPKKPLQRPGSELPDRLTSPSGPTAQPVGPEGVQPVAVLADERSSQPSDSIRFIHFIHFPRSPQNSGSASGDVFVLSVATRLHSGKPAACEAELLNDQHRCFGI